MNSPVEQTPIAQRPERRRAACVWRPAQVGGRWRTDCRELSREYDPRAVGWRACPFCGARLEVEDK